MKARTFFLVVGLLGVLPAAAQEWSIEERVRHKRAVEEVTWRHRIWPAENRAPKPRLAEVMPDAALREAVEDDLKKSKALETLWQRPITADQLQAELDRLVRETRDAATLAEIFDALGNNPETIAECFARPLLADRLIRDWYAHDSRFHGALRRRAEAARDACGDASCMRTMGGTYVERSYGPDIRSDRLTADRTVRLDAAALSTLRATITAPLGQVGALEETWDGFTVRALIGEDGEGFTIAGVTWPKESFNIWWQARRASLPAEVVVPSGSYTVPSIDLGGCTPDAWTPTYIGAPDSRFGHTAVWTGNEMIVYGGGSPVGGRYNPATNTWAQLYAGTGNPSARTAHSAVWTGSEMIVWGGQTTGFSPTSLADGARYNPASDTWTPLPSAGAPAARFGHAAVWTGSLMIVWGGTGGGVAGARYNPSTDAWSPTSISGVPGARAGVTAVWSGSEAIFWGGVDGGVELNTGGRYNPASDSWVSTTTTAAPSARRGHTAVWTGTEMIVWGGSTGGAIHNTGGRYNPAANTWVATSTLAPAPPARSLHTAVWTGSRMIIWGGALPGPQNQSGGIYDPVTNGWVATPVTANTPVSRELHTAVWSGTEMLLWGGRQSGGGSMNTGARFSPATNTWAPISSGTFVPEARQAHSAVWTGIEMIVWGGSNPFFLASGGRYSLTTNTWTPTAIDANVPLPRANHTAVWTGLRMVVWGGEDSAGVVDTGGRYDAFADAWTMTSLSGAPTPRMFHTAVWTGSEMIIWGGGDQFLTPYNTGGRYNPISNTWTATPTAGAPVPRMAHAAVWVGDSMILWGGADATHFGVNTGGTYVPSSGAWVPTALGPNVPSPRFWPAAAYAQGELLIWGGGGMNENTGGRYFPPLNQWNPTSTIGAPSARESMSFVWTGDKLVVWGGQNRFPPAIPALHTGGRYKYQTNTWSATSVLGSVPSARVFHTAVWTGTQMVVWGGFPLTTTGGIYCPDECASPTTYYLDADHDGYGTTLSKTTACALPPGYSTLSTDCDDTDADTYPMAQEINDGEDNQCPGDPGFGVTDEISGDSVFTGPQTVCWPGQIGAAVYEVVRSTEPDFSTDCLRTQTSTTCLTDPFVPPFGAGFYYLVRAFSPNIGSWGQDSSGAERSIGCP